MVDEKITFDELMKVIFVTDDVPMPQVQTHLILLDCL